MIINKIVPYTSLKPDNTKQVNLNNIKKFNKEFSEKYTNFMNDNIILDFSEINNISSEEILLFSQVSMEHKKNKKSFVIVCGTGMDLDMINDELVMVPTFQEAEDVIEIEEIERDLGI